MSSILPIFTIAEPQHYSDYGFDPHIDYFQQMEEARGSGKRAKDPLRLKIRKPISKDGPKSMKRRRWWKSALLFWKRDDDKAVEGGISGHRAHRAVTGPMYQTEFGSGAPCRTSSGSTPLGFPYVSLRGFNSMDEGNRISVSSPMYLVT